MKVLLSIILIKFVIYSTQAGECQVHNQPDYLSIVTNKNEDNSKQYSISDFINNLQTLLGLASDQNENHAKPLFFSTRPFEIPSSTWLFHVEGIPQLSKNGIALQDDDVFHIDSIQNKLSRTGNSDALNTVSILLTSQSDIDNLEKTLEDQISKFNKQAPIKYIVIVCDSCDNEESTEKLQNLLQSTIDKVIVKDPQSLTMTLATQESARVRRARQADEQTRANVTIATMYSDEYSTMFNLFFWTSLVLGLIIISIVYVFLTLDPGSDTIIYRMTQPRLKVD